MANGQPVPGPAPMPIVDHGQAVWGQAIGPVGPDTFQNAVVRMEDLTTGQMTTLATKAGAPTFQWPWIIWGQVTTGSDGYENIKNLQTGQQMQLQAKAATLALDGTSLAYDDINSLYLIDDFTQTPLKPNQLMSASGSIHFQWVTLSDRLVAWTEDAGVEVWDRTQHVFVRLPISNGRSDSWMQGRVLVWFDPEPADQQQQDIRNNLLPTPTLDILDTTTLPTKPVK
jgi:hypothetical protein